MMGNRWSRTEDIQVMEVDGDDHQFMVNFLSQFNGIDNDTINVLKVEGYNTRMALLALDFSEDLPALPLANLAQRSLLRNALKQLHEMNEIDEKIDTIVEHDDSTGRLPRNRSSSKRRFNDDDDESLGMPLLSPLKKLNNRQSLANHSPYNRNTNSLTRAPIKHETSSEDDSLPPPVTSRYTRSKASIAKPPSLMPQFGGMNESSLFSDVSDNDKGLSRIYGNTRRGRLNSDLSGPSSSGQSPSSGRLSLANNDRIVENRPSPKPKSRKSLLPANSTLTPAMIEVKQNLEKKRIDGSRGRGMRGRK